MMCNVNTALRVVVIVLDLVLYIKVGNEVPNLSLLSLYTEVD